MNLLRKSEADNLISNRPERKRPSIVPMLVSFNFHLLLLVSIAFLVFESEQPSKQLALEVSFADSNTEITMHESVEIAPTETQELAQEPILIETTQFTSLNDLTAAIQPLTLGDFDLAPLVTGNQNDDLGVSVPGSFAEKIAYARKNGIEILIVFDATGSMGSEISAVRQRIGQISQAVLEKIPAARFSLVAYRDRSDAISVAGIKLGNSKKKLGEFMDEIVATGGGDTPEGVELGMEWAISQNKLRSNSHNVMLIFGDAPPHYQRLDACIDMAARFGSSGKGTVHTISCRSRKPIQEFSEIAKAGGGQAYTMTNSHNLTEELLVLAFGPEHREEVDEFFDLGLGRQEKQKERSKQKRSKR